MAKSAPSATGLGLLGGGTTTKSHSLPWWVKLAGGVVLSLLLWFVVLDLALFVVLWFFCAGIGWVCAQDKGNILLTIAVVVAATLFVGTRMKGPMEGTSNGVKAFGSEGVGAFGDGMRGIHWPENAPAPPAPAGPTTTTPPVLAPTPVAAP